MKHNLLLLRPIQFFICGILYKWWKWSWELWLAEEVKVNQISQRFVLISQMTILTFKAAEISVTSLTFNTNKFNLWPLSKTLTFQMDIWHFYYQIWSPHVCTVQYNLPRLKLQKDTQKWWKWRKRYWDLSPKNLF